jgi:copper chaperone
MTTETIAVPEIHCGHCKNAIEGALNPMAAVREASVDVEARVVTVDYDDSAIGRAEVVRVIEDLGYEVPDNR